MSAFTYLIDSDNAHARDIIEMQGLAREVSFVGTFAKRCDWKSWAREKGYAIGAGSPGLHLRYDYSVFFYRSVYLGERCYYIDHGGIQYVFSALRTGRVNWLCKPREFNDELPMDPTMRGCGHIWSDSTQPLICPQCLNPLTQIDRAPAKISSTQPERKMK